MIHLRGLLAAVAVMSGAASAPASAAAIWHSSQSAFLTAAPLSADPTGMSAVTTDAQANALMQANGIYDPVTNFGADFALGAVTFTVPVASYHGFAMNIDGGTPGSTYGFTGASYRIGNAVNENHSVLIGGAGASAFGFSIYEPTSLAQCGNVGCIVSRFDVVARDAGGAVIGSQAIDFTAAGGLGFIGVVADTAIARIDLYETRLAGGCCMYDNEYFGNYLMTAFGAAQAVPEPATWAMMIAGFGLVGAGMRRRSGTVATA